MAKIRREEAIRKALNLLNEVGLDGLTTRRLAQRLGVESPTLYWHFKNKEELLNEMSTTVLARHHIHPVPQSTERWQSWLVDNARSFRRALLAYRDGARLHAGTTPSADELNRITAKVGYLVRAGFAEQEAVMTLYSIGQFTLGCVLEEQARTVRVAITPENLLQHASPSGNAFHLAEQMEDTSSDTAFEFGLSLLVKGLERRLHQTEGSGKPVRHGQD